MQAWQGKGSAIINFYTGGLVDHTQLSQTLSAIWDQDHAVPMISWTGASSDQQAACADGAYDINIDDLAQTLKTFVEGPDGVYGNSDDRRLYYRYDYEANGSWSQYAPNYYTGGTYPDQLVYLQNVQNFKACWAHTHDRFTTAGLDSNHVAWVFAVENKDSYRPNNGMAVPPDYSSRKVMEDIYPGNAYVDWVAIDGYNRGTDPDGWQTPDQVFTPMMNRLMNKAPSKPVGISEVGSTSLNGTMAAQKSQWITDYFTWLQSSPMKMSVWFNSDQNSDYSVFGGTYADENNTTYTSSTTGQTYNAYATYASAVGSSSWFLASDTSNPRLLTDAQFLGQ